MDYPVLAAELTNDPVSLGYAGLTHAQAAAKLNATNTGRTRNRTAVTSREVFNCIDSGAWPAAGSQAAHMLQVVLAMDYIDASNTNTRGILGTVFPNSGATAATRTRLLALATEPISRATELNLETVTEGDVARARAGTW